MSEDEFVISMEDDLANSRMVLYMSHRPTGLSYKFILTQAVLQDGVLDELIELYIRRFVETVDKVYPKIEVTTAPLSLDDWTTAHSSYTITLPAGSTVWPGTTTTVATGPTYTPRYYTTTTTNTM